MATRQALFFAGTAIVGLAEAKTQLEEIVINGSRSSIAWGREHAPVIGLLSVPCAGWAAEEVFLNTPMPTVKNVLERGKNGASEQAVDLLLGTEIMTGYSPSLSQRKGIELGLTRAVELVTANSEGILMLATELDRNGRMSGDEVKDYLIDHDISIAAYGC